MPSDFKELNLDQTRLRNCVEEFWSINNVQRGEYSIETLLKQKYVKLKLTEAQ
ncbi:MAG: hypothetical protein PUP91_13085 [Rhizonema sp. PD37]|nr:hypothetical protein [Rhizonema sp. PD37]